MYQEEEETQTQTQRLSDFSEGAVGKLIIRKSGKTQLVIGNITMDVSMGTKCGFLQVNIQKVMTFHNQISSV